MLVRTSGRYSGRARRRRSQLAADQAPRRLGGRRRHHRVRAAQREERRRLRGHPRARTRPRSGRSNRPAKGGDTGAMLAQIIERAAKLKSRARAAGTKARSAATRPRTAASVQGTTQKHREKTRQKEIAPRAQRALRSIVLSCSPRWAPSSSRRAQNVPTTRADRLSRSPKARRWRRPRRPTAGRSRSICSAALWILPFRRRRGEADHARAARGAPADLVARQPVDRLPGLRRRRLAHLRDPARRRRREGDHERRVRRSRAGLVARRIAHRVLVGSLRRHHHHLGSRGRAPARSGRSASATAGCRPGRRNDRRDHVRLADGCAASAATRAAGASPGSGPSTRTGASACSSPTRRRTACRRRAAWSPNGTDLAYVAGGRARA